MAIHSLKLPHTILYGLSFPNVQRVQESAEVLGRELLYNELKGSWISSLPHGGKSTLANFSPHPLDSEVGRNESLLS